MGGIPWTLWLPSHVTLDTPDTDPAPGLVRLQETGTKKPPTCRKQIYVSDKGSGGSVRVQQQLSILLKQYKSQCMAQLSLVLVGY